MSSTPYDAKRLMKAAIRDNNPVCFLWHGNLMRRKVPTEDYVVLHGPARVKRQGTNVTVLASGQQVHNALVAAESLVMEISVEVIDVRIFEPFDMDTLRSHSHRDADCQDRRN